MTGKWKSVKHGRRLHIQIPKSFPEMYIITPTLGHGRNLRQFQFIKAYLKQTIKCFLRDDKKILKSSEGFFNFSTSSAKIWLSCKYPVTFNQTATFFVEILFCLLVLIRFEEVVLFKGLRWLDGLSTLWSTPVNLRKTSNSTHILN